MGRRFVGCRPLFYRINHGVACISRKKKKTSLRSLGTMVKEHVKSKFRQRRMHTMEVKRIQDDMEKSSHHFKKKQEEMSKLKEKKKQQLQKRLQSRKK